LTALSISFIAGTYRKQTIWETESKMKLRLGFVLATLMLAPAHADVVGLGGGSSAKSIYKTCWKTVRASTSTCNMFLAPSAGWKSRRFSSMT
jgi:hypothetical protein